MWSLRMCVMACACAWAVMVTALAELPCEKPPCISERLDSNGDQSKDFKKRETTKSLEAHTVTVDEGIYVNDESYLRRPRWIHSSRQTASSLTQLAFVAGQEVDGSPMWAIRARYGRGVIPGKLGIQSRAAYIPLDGREVPVENFEVLCAPQHCLRWANVGCEFEHLPDAAISAGFNDCGEPLYIARCNYKGSTVPGKYNPKRGPAFISFDGGEVPCWDFRILTVAKH